MRIGTLVWGLVAFLVVGLTARAADICPTPESMDLVAIQFANNVGVQDRALVLQIAVRYEQQDGADFTVEMPGKVGFLRLDQNNVRKFSSPILVDNTEFTRITITVIEVPSDISKDALSFVFAGLKGIADAALDHAFREQPLLGLFAGPFVDNLTDEIRAEMERGDIFALANSNARDAALMPYIQSDDGVFRVYVKPNCSEFQKSLN